MIRLLPACLGVNLSNANSVARRMSESVSVMEEFVSLTIARGISAVVSQCRRTEVSAGDAALLLCEAAKALVVLGVLPPNTAEWTSDALRTAFASKATTALLKNLSKQIAFSDEDISHIACPRAREGKDINAALPPTRCSWDSEPHYCIGAEMMAQLAAKRLARIGWLDPTFGADVFDDVG